MGFVQLGYCSLQFGCNKQRGSTLIFLIERFLRSVVLKRVVDLLKRPGTQTNLN